MGHVQSNNYWSSTSIANNPNNAWIVDMNNGNVNNNNKTNNNYVWPVRSGEWDFPMFTFENLHASYLACRRRKRATVNALRFEMRCEENLIALLEELQAGLWRPSRSVCFIVEKPKMREIVAADFRDRIVHHLLVERLEAMYEPVFVHDSYACRLGKGVHRAVLRVQDHIRRAGRNGREPLFFAHLDVRNFFMTIDKEILMGLLRRKVRDTRLLGLAEKIIFHEPAKNCIIKGNPALVQHLPPHKSLFHAPEGKGLPVGNLTSQFFANVYLNELDQFVKHTLKRRFYARYCDDFLLVDRDPEALAQAREHIREFLAGRLVLSLNEKFEAVKPVNEGIDFLGYIIRPHYRLARRRVVNSMKTKLMEFERKFVTHEPGMTLLHYDYGQLEKLRAVLASYMGHLKWADTYNLRRSLLERYGFLQYFFSFDAPNVPQKKREIIENRRPDKEPGSQQIAQDSAGHAGLCPACINGVFRHEKNVIASKAKRSRMCTAGIATARGPAMTDKEPEWVKTTTSLMQMGESGGLHPPDNLCAGRAKGKIRPRYRFNEMLRRVSSQYFYYARHFSDAAVFVRSGCFYEAYGKRTLAIEALGLNRLGANRRKATYGFPARLARQYAAKLASQGMSVVFVGETDRSMGKIKVRLPEVRVMGVGANNHSPLRGSGEKSNAIARPKSVAIL